MKNSYHRLFGYLEIKNAPAGLRVRIERSIASLQSASLRRQILLLKGVGSLSLITLVPSFIYAASEFTRSSFGEYVSLLTSDADIALLNWKEFSLSLLDAFPLSGITLVLGSIFTALIAFDFIARTKQAPQSSLLARFA